MVKLSLLNAFQEINTEIFKKVSDVRFSGSTCTSVFIYGRKVYCANVGDSRTILIRLDNNNEDGCATGALSNDHKPDDVDESMRILEKNGRIDCFKDQFGNQIGPLRVWLKHEDIPGLAMTRSFGDSTAARVGVIAIPEIKEHELNPDDKVLVLASDGVWEFLSNQEVANIIYPYYL